MRVSVLFSGGTDSTYAAYLVQQQGWEVGSLLTVVPRAEDSYMFHHPNIGWTGLQAEAMGIPIRTVESPGKKEEELDDLAALMRTEDVDGFVSGAISSDYQWSRLHRLCHELGKPLFSPLWRKDELRIIEEMLHAGMEFMVVGAFADGLGATWLGRTVDNAALAELLALRDRHGISIAGEGGELETFVVDGPCFSRRVDIRDSEKTWTRDSGTLRITDAVLVSRQ
ncbi:MAG TPA: diphthine--ammonia ligase [Thermoplasmata archaeon]|nr:diphthine--ammonia ligase [Thermoplasmata archaeon]